MVTFRRRQVTKHENGLPFGFVLEITKHLMEKDVPSLKLTYPPKIGGWKMNFLLGWPIFEGKLLVLGSVTLDL